ncbi:MAG: hypothetical protein LBQ83_07650 [Candidatus Margulisbacteria bacterium]|nr:hypothetical protein [Candidatus Margulisiibacteriota bacterium]
MFKEARVVADKPKPSINLEISKTPLIKILSNPKKATVNMPEAETKFVKIAVDQNFLPGELQKIFFNLEATSMLL